MDSKIVVNTVILYIVVAFFAVAIALFIDENVVDTIGDSEESWITLTVKQLLFVGFLAVVVHGMDTVLKDWNPALDENRMP